MQQTKSNQGVARLSCLSCSSRINRLSRAAWMIATALSVALASIPARCKRASAAVKELAAPAPIQLPLKPSAEFAKFPRYAGTLGARQIVLRLGAKTDDPSGVHGEYQFTDTGEVILIAGDRDGDTLEVEESNDGTHITGNWVGKFAADGTLAGERMNVDDSNPQPVRSASACGGRGAACAGRTWGGQQAAAASVPAAPAGGHPVGGVSNLSTASERL